MFNLENEQQPIFIVQAVKLENFSTLCFAEKEGVSPFCVKSCDDLLHMGIFKILEKLKNDKNVLCATFLVHSKGIVRKKEMINLREFEEKL